MLTFTDKDDEERILETYANSYDFQVYDEEIKEYFQIGGNRSYGNLIQSYQRDRWIVGKEQNTNHTQDSLTCISKQI